MVETIYIPIAAALIIIMILLARAKPKKHALEEEFIEIDNQEYYDSDDDISETPNILEDLPEVITLYLVPNTGSISGSQLMQFFVTHGLQFGEQKIFHHTDRGHITFSVATLTPPGTFNIQDMTSQSFSGLTFFLQTAHTNPLDNFDSMCEILFHARDAFDASIRSQDQSDLTGDELQEWRDLLSVQQGETLIDA